MMPTLLQLCINKFQETIIQVSSSKVHDIGDTPSHHIVVLFYYNLYSKYMVLLHYNQYDH